MVHVCAGTGTRMPDFLLEYQAKFFDLLHVEVLSRRLSGQTLPEKRGNSRVEVGNVDWEVNQARILPFTAPSSHVAVSPHSAMTWTTTNAGIQVCWASLASCHVPRITFTAGVNF